MSKKSVLDHLHISIYQLLWTLTVISSLHFTARNEKPFWLEFACCSHFCCIRGSIIIPIIKINATSINIIAISVLLLSEALWCQLRTSRRPFYCYISRATGILSTKMLSYARSKIKLSSFKFFFAKFLT